VGRKWWYLIQKQAGWKVVVVVVVVVVLVVEVVAVVVVVVAVVLGTNKIHTSIVKSIIYTRPPTCFGQTRAHLQGSKIQRMSTMKIVIKLLNCRNQSTVIK
jgi:hypothetical protein